MIELSFSCLISFIPVASVDSAASMNSRLLTMVGYLEHQVYVRMKRSTMGEVQRVVIGHNGHGDLAV